MVDAVHLALDLGDDEDIEKLDAHLAARGLGVDDLLAAAGAVVPRRKGDRLYAYGRGDWWATHRDGAAAAEPRVATANCMADG